MKSELFNDALPWLVNAQSCPSDANSTYLGFYTMCAPPTGVRVTKRLSPRNIHNSTGFHGWYDTVGVTHLVLRHCSLHLQYYLEENAVAVHLKTYNSYKVEEFKFLHERFHSLPHTCMYPNIGNFSCVVDKAIQNHEREHIRLSARVVQRKPTLVEFPRVDRKHIEISLYVPQL